MSKWKCGICNNEFDNFQAQGFGGTIYCPLCYFKELYRRTELERERLNNIIDTLKIEISKLMGRYFYEKEFCIEDTDLDKLLRIIDGDIEINELKGDNK